ncbi:hypothetical protein NEIRO03_0759 [Nematocida sp. AWRm78]|nr:hypothetical protein NEIRO02_1056 [Nematocida sp. AWRm79]KAI5183137.1 hypothetical protein NEIRO03_0759 [Nematocida sp. AWRm78]
MYKYSVKNTRQVKNNSIPEDINTKLKIIKNKKSVNGILKESMHLQRNPENNHKTRKYHRDGVINRLEDDHKSNKKEIKDLINQIRSEVDFTQNPYDVIETIEDLIWLEESIRDSSCANKVRYMAMGINTVTNPDLSVLKRKIKEYQEVLEVNESKNRVEKWSDVKEHLLDIICEYGNEKVFKVPLLKNCYNNWRVWVERVLANIWCDNYSVKELKEEISRGKGYPAEWSGIDFTQTPRQIKDKLIKYSECTEGRDKKSTKITVDSIINSSTRNNHKKPEKRIRKVNPVIQDISNYNHEQGEESSLNIQCTEHILKRDLYTVEIHQNNRIEEEMDKPTKADKAGRMDNKADKVGRMDNKADKADKVGRMDNKDRLDKADNKPSRSDKADRLDNKADRPDRSSDDKDRPDRPNKTDRPDNKADRSDRLNNKADRLDRPDRADRSDKPSKPDRLDNKADNKTDRSDRLDRADRSDRPNKTDRSDNKPSRPDRLDKAPSFYFESGGKRALLQVREISPL